MKRTERKDTGMRILIVNDDGIRSPGLVNLARQAKELGEVWVVAPASQCSAMSHRITVFGSVRVEPEPDFPVEGVKAYSISGTPADCVKTALSYVMKEKPDVVFSGINNGYNVGVDILYSGTIGAAMESLVQGIPAIAFSNQMNGDQRVSERYLLPIARDLLAREISGREIWNVNFPGGDPDQVKGILEDRVPSKKSYYETIYTPAGEGALPGEPLPGAADAAADDPRTAAGPAGAMEKRNGIQGEETQNAAQTAKEPGAAKAGYVPAADLMLSSIVAADAEDGTDMKALFDGYISIGKVKNAVL